MTKHFVSIFVALTAIAGLVAPAAQASPAKSKLRFSATSYAVAENAGNATITVTRSPRSGKAKSATNTIVSVSYATSNGTALAGVDYTATSGRLTFPACGSNPAATDPCLQQHISVPIADDSVVNGNRTVKLALTTPTRNAVVVNPQKTTLTIADNEGPSHVSFDAPSYSVWELGPQVEIHVIRSGAGISGSASVDFATSDAGAMAPGDYAAKTATLSFAPGEVDKTIFVDITDDSVVEPTETFDVGLSNPSAGVTVDTSSEQVTILDDDTVTDAHVGFDISSYSVGEAGDVTITVNRTASISTPVTVDYATIAQTATADVDFTAAGDTLSFDPGDTSQSFTISTLPDNLHEGDETFAVQLQNQVPAGTVVDGNGSTTVTIGDDDPVPTISAGTGTASGGTVTFPIDLSNPTTTPVTVDYVITDSNGNVVGSGTATIPAGASGTTVSAPASGDGTLSLTLSNPTGGSIDPGSSSSQSGPTISVGSGSVDSGTGTVTFPIALSGSSPDPVSVDYVVTDSSGAVVGSGTATIAPGDTGTTVTVPAGGDGPWSIEISNPTGGAIDPSASSGTSTTATTPAGGSGTSTTGSSGSTTIGGSGTTSGDPAGSAASTSPATSAAGTSTTTPAGSGSKRAAAAADEAVLRAGLDPCGLTIRVTRRLDKRGRLIVRLSARHRCTVTLGASIRGKGRRPLAARVLRALKTKRLTATVVKGRVHTLRLRFSKRALGFIRRALAAHRPLALTVAAIERDARRHASKRTLRTGLHR